MTFANPRRLLQRGHLEPKALARGAARPSIGPGVSYAIGDIHGRLDLLNALLASIRAAEAGTPPEDLTVIFLGDFVDRGPQSAEVVETVRLLAGAGWCKVAPLKGNHEEMMLRFLEGPRIGPEWLKLGGAATLRAYGVPPPPAGAPRILWEAAQAAFAAAVPAEHVAFLRSLALYHESGDYVFVHAGVKPDVPLAEQAERDLLWIRGEFTRCERPMERIVVYGHTPSAQPVLETWKIGLDTGAYASGLLTGIRLEASERRIVQSTG